MNDKTKGATAPEEKHDATTGEILPALPVLSNEQKTATLPSGVKISVAKIVNYPLLVHPEGADVFVTVLTKIYPGKEIKGQKMAAADMVRVLDLVTMTEKEYIVRAVLKGHWDESYPKESFVGKSFAIHAEPKREGKRYATVSLIELTIEKDKK